MKPFMFLNFTCMVNVITLKLYSTLRTMDKGIKSIVHESNIQQPDMFLTSETKFYMMTATDVET